MTPRRVKLVVLFGGRSAEHDVSRVTASHVLRAVDPLRYEITAIAIDRQGRWHLAEDVVKALAEGPDALPDELPVGGVAVEPLAALTPEVPDGGPSMTGIAPAATGDRSTATSDDGTAPTGPGWTPTVVLPLLHGPFGEDGTVQGLLELAGVPYVGAGVLGSALAMDKAKAREVFAHHGIPQARWLSYRAGELPRDVGSVVGERLGYPCFTKPANLGSSVGVCKVHDERELAAAIELAFGYDEWLVVEEAIPGREIELGVLGNGDPRVSVPGEIIPGAEFYDYDDKYLDDRAKLLVPAPLPPSVVEELQRLALLAYRAVRGDGMARVDFFYEEEGRSRGPLLNEVNTIPGFTPISMYPKLWAASGVPYAALIDELVDLALDRWQRRQARIRTDR
jgi:D-alanine-D-alanine ligase